MRNIILMTLLALATLTLLVSFNSKPIDGECEKYKTGTFSYHFKSNGNVIYFTVTRDKLIQTEKNEQSGNISKFKVTWISDCSYELKFLETTEILSKEFLSKKKKLVIMTTILRGEKDYYLFKSTSKMYSHILQDTIWVKK